MLHRSLLAAWVLPMTWMASSAAFGADLPTDAMRQLKSPVSGYRGEIGHVELLPDGGAELTPGPDFSAMARAALHYLGNNPVPENHYQCRFLNMLLKYPPTPLPDPSKDLLDPTTVGDTESRNDIAFNQMRKSAARTPGGRHKRRSTSGSWGTCDRSPARWATTCAGVTCTPARPTSILPMPIRGRRPSCCKAKWTCTARPARTATGNWRDGCSTAFARPPPGTPAVRFLPTAVKVSRPARMPAAIPATTRTSSVR